MSHEYISTNPDKCISERSHLRMNQKESRFYILHEAIKQLPMLLIFVN